MILERIIIDPWNTTFHWNIETITETRKGDTWDQLDGQILM